MEWGEERGRESRKPNNIGGSIQQLRVTGKNGGQKIRDVDELLAVEMKEVQAKR